MLVLLPPSETKAPGGRGAPLDLAALSFPTLGPARARVLAALQTVSSTVGVARKVLKLSARQDDELTANLALRTAPTMPALRRYTGVLYDALDYPTLPASARRRADRTVVVVSALFGALRPRDPIPAYRLSGGTTLPGLGPLRGVWRDELTAVLRDDRLVLDLRSGAYQALGPVPGAVTVRVVSVRPDGSRAIVSHFNKAYKGRLARAVLTASRVRTIEDVVLAAKAADLAVTRTGEAELELEADPV
ncbi:YaaA family protein [Actinocatenispora rupis]|uniref:Peroxide stress protein YaaA n=1 Tax=Actinocatenispora rupis TaxID=519421 RepID=A0A8J3J518_9ACTN|nr:peroxide stress protein YaaA [Actinocatenispora rupis]GID09508.1 peroxide stress protein YaaA [Actinocatenispora rupis]